MLKEENYYCDAIIYGHTKVIHARCKILPLASKYRYYLDVWYLHENVRIKWRPVPVVLMSGWAHRVKETLKSSFELNCQGPWLKDNTLTKGNQIAEWIFTICLQLKLFLSMTKFISKNVELPENDFLVWHNSFVLFTANFLVLLLVFKLREMNWSIIFCGRLSLLLRHTWCCIRRVFIAFVLFD